MTFNGIFKCIYGSQFNHTISSKRLSIVASWIHENILDLNNPTAINNQKTKIYIVVSPEEEENLKNNY
jgi:hypothetical protein